MEIFTEIVKVEIIRPWWDDALPLVAIVLSLGTLIWTIWDRSQGTAKLKVKDRGFKWDVDEARTYLRLVVRNKGRSDSTVVTSATLTVPYEVTKDGPTALLEPREIEQKMPIRLQPGDPLTLYFDTQMIQEVLHGVDAKSKDAMLGRCRLEVEAGHEDIRYKLSRRARAYLWQETKKEALAEVGEGTA